MSIQHIVLFDGDDRNHLLPLTATRAVADLRIGILTIKEKWQNYFDGEVEILTQQYLQPKYTFHQTANTVFINAHFLPNREFLQQVLEMKMDSCWISEQQELIACCISNRIQNIDELKQTALLLPAQSKQLSTYHIKYPWDIFTYNGQEIRNDIQCLGLKPNPEKLSSTNSILGNEIYVGENVTCEYAILNAKNGPIYLADDSEIMEGCTIRAPFALGTHASLKMQTKVYGDTTIGPYSKVGGEISNTVIIGYSNKGHDGFLGNSVIGEWCNLGADTNNSNLKNNYGKVSAYNYPAKDVINTGLQFCGLIMGDHAKAAINTQFNTGTVVGVAANVFDAGFPPKFIPDFSWGKSSVFELDKAYEVAQRVMERRQLNLSETDKNILKYIFENR